jgi:hypothetical protein
VWVLLLSCWLHACVANVNSTTVRLLSHINDQCKFFRLTEDQPCAVQRNCLTQCRVWHCDCMAVARALWMQIGQRDGHSFSCTWSVWSSFPYWSPVEHCSVCRLTVVCRRCDCHKIFTLWLTVDVNVTVKQVVPSCARISYVTVLKPVRK